jgi:hypothetical protein
MTMAVSLAQLDELRSMEAAAPEYGGSDLSMLETIEELYGWLIANARAEGDDEGDTVETFARFSGATAPEARRVATTLMALGYTTAAERLRDQRQATARSPAAAIKYGTA